MSTVRTMSARRAKPEVTGRRSKRHFGGEGDVEGTPRMDRFRSRLRELGWTEGTNLQLMVRFGGNNGERIRQAAAELVASRRMPSSRRR
jgi:hypothetical protein